MHHFNPIASFGRTAVVATSLMSMASAHLFIAEPKPIQGSAPKDPLDPSGSNFPCHGAPLPTSGGQKMVAGETFPLQFEMAEGANTAVHGGGSCQLAILTDTSNAADPSSWNVIYSIEGGCPSNTKGNLDAPLSAVACTSADQGDCVHSWDIPMPKGVKSGNAILSWTWFNTIGNREMYQNCVNVDITGGTGDGEFPPLFVANLASVNDVKTTENSDVLFPEPGEFVTTMSATNGDNFPKATVASGDSGKGPGGYTAPKETSAPAYSAPASSPPAYSAPAPSAPAQSAPAYSASAPIASQIQSYDNQKQKQTYTTFATATSSAAKVPATAAPSSEAPAPTGYSSGSSNSGSNNTSSSDTTKCSEDGALICIGDDSFGICDHGYAVKRPLSKGTACTNGVISGINRFRRHVHGNAHKH